MVGNPADSIQSSDFSGGACIWFCRGVAWSHVSKPDESFGSPFVTVVLYALAANLCYTLGWITELLWSWGDTAQTEKTRLKVFRLGLIFSMGLTLLPAIILSLTWAMRSIR
jgi:hypothetical protein